MPAGSSTLTKKSIDDLALFGGAPAFVEQLHVGRPNIGDRRRLMERIQDLLDRRWLTNDGPFVQQFEEQVAARARTRFCVATCNATIALQMAIRALRLTGEVIVPSFTFIAGVHALTWQGLTPVFCDIGLRDFCLDPAAIESLITERTSAILPVHMWGHPCDVDAIAEIARRHRLRVLYDAAHAFGCSRNGRPVGGFGDAEVFSFHATKFLNSFEGGAVVTNNPELAAELWSIRNFGFTAEDEVSSIGINGKMTEIAAAMGLTSLESMEEFIAANRRNYDEYRKHLQDVPGLSLLEHGNGSANYHYIVVEVDGEATGISRDALHQLLNAERVIARRYFYPGCHRAEPYRTMFPDAHKRLPRTERAAARLLCLPTGTAVGPVEITRVCELLRFLVANAGTIQRRMHLELAVPQ